MDDAGRDPGDPAGPASARSARRRPLRDLRSQRPLPPRDQPEQPAQAAPGAQRSRDHHPQREADAAGGGRRAVRQRPPRQDHHRPQQAAAEVALRHAEGQAGAVPPEPARQARRLLGPFGHRRRPRAEAAPVRPAQEDGARAVQAVHLQQARRARPRHHHQERQEAGREGASRGVGHPRRGHQGAPDSPQPRADAAPPGHPGVRAAAHRGQGHPAAPAGLRGVQRRLRRRPDGGARAAVAGGADGSARAHDEHEQHPLARQRPPDHPALAGHRARALLHDARADLRQGRVPARQARGRRRTRRRDVKAEKIPANKMHGVFASPEEVRMAYDHGELDLQAAIRVRIDGELVAEHHRPRAAVRDRPQAAAVQDRQPRHGQEAARRSHRQLLPRLRPEGDRPPGRQAAVARLHLRDQGRHLDLRRRSPDPGAQDRAARDGAEGRAGDRGAVHRGSHHRRRALQQGRRHLGAGLGADRRRDDERDRHRGARQRRDRREAAQPVVQPDLHHGRLGRARFGPADPAAGRDARPHGQALGRDHRDPHHHQLPRGALGPPVLHLDPRRPQGSGGHRAQDGELRVPHPASRRRGAGLHHRRVRLRHHRRHRARRAGRGRRDHREAR